MTFSWPQIGDADLGPSPMDPIKELSESFNANYKGKLQSHINKSIVDDDIAAVEFSIVAPFLSRYTKTLFEVKFSVEKTYPASVYGTVKHNLSDSSIDKIVCNNEDNLREILEKIGKSEYTAKLIVALLSNSKSWR